MQKIWKKSLSLLLVLFVAVSAFGQTFRGTVAGTVGRRPGSSRYRRRNPTEQSRDRSRAKDERLHLQRQLRPHLPRRGGAPGLSYGAVRHQSQLLTKS